MTGRARKAFKYMTDSESPVKAVISMFLSSGPWAVMTLALVLGIGYEAHRLVGTAGSAVSGYVVQSTKNNEIVMELAKKGEQQRLGMMSSMTSLNDAIEMRQKEHDTQTLKLDMLLSKVEDACKKAPAERKELLDALNEIKHAIEALKLNP